MTPEMIPEALDRRTRSEIDRALRLAKEHPRLYALVPAGNAALAIGLGVYSLLHLATTFVIFFSAD